MASDTPKPRMNIRRFDDFAEWNRLTGLKKRVDAEDAQAYGLAVAKIVAARKFSRTRSAKVALSLAKTRARPP